MLLRSPYIWSHYGKIAQLIREVKYVLLQMLWTVRSRRGLSYLADRMLLLIVKTSRLRVPMTFMVSLDVPISTWLITRLPPTTSPTAPDSLCGLQRSTWLDLRQKGRR